MLHERHPSCPPDPCAPLLPAFRRPDASASGHPRTDIPESGSPPAHPDHNSHFRNRGNQTVDRRHCRRHRLRRPALLAHSHERHHNCLRPFPCAFAPYCGGAHGASPDRAACSPSDYRHADADLLLCLPSQCFLLPVNLPVHRAHSGDLSDRFSLRDPMGPAGPDRHAADPDDRPLSGNPASAGASLGSGAGRCRVPADFRRCPGQSAAAESG